MRMNSDVGDEGRDNNAGAERTASGHGYQITHVTTTCSDIRLHPDLHRNTHNDEHLIASHLVSLLILFLSSITTSGYHTIH
jgi:hypothetical protein